MVDKGSEPANNPKQMVCLRLMPKGSVQDSPERRSFAGGSMDLGSALRRSAERFPARCAVGGPRPLTYAEWDARTDRLAAAVAAAGVRAGERVLLALGGGEPLASLHLAVNDSARSPCRCRSGSPLPKSPTASTTVRPPWSSPTTRPMPSWPRHFVAHGPARRSPGRRSWQNSTPAAGNPQQDGRRPTTRSASCCIPPAPQVGRRVCPAPTAPSARPPSRTSSRPGSRWARSASA